MAAGVTLGHLLAEQVDQLNLARTVSRPHLVVIDRKHAVRPHVIVARCRTGEGVRPGRHNLKERGARGRECIDDKMRKVDPVECPCE